MATETVRSQTVEKGRGVTRSEIIRLFHNLSDDMILEKRHENLETKPYCLIIIGSEAEVGTSVWNVSREYPAPTQ